MNHEPLLEDLFRTKEIADFEKESLADLLANVRRKSRRQKTRRFAGVMLVMASLAFGLYQFRPSNEIPQVAESPPDQIPKYLVRTKPLDSSRMVAAKSNNYQTIRSTRDSTLVVRTDFEGKSLQRIGDQELFALFPDEPVTLVRYSPSHVELIVLDSWESRESPH